MGEGEEEGVPTALVSVRPGSMLSLYNLITFSCLVVLGSLCKAHQPRALSLTSTPSPSCRRFRNIPENTASPQLAERLGSEMHFLL